MARIVEIIPGNDGKIRSVRVMKGDKKTGIYPVNKLYPLELSLTNVPQSNDQSCDEIPVQRPVRSAARRCKEQLKLQ